MELQFSDLNVARLALCASSQALVEGELPLPEGRQSAEVLCASGSVSIAGAAVGEGAVTLDGRVRVELICRDAEEVFAFASSAGFRHTFPAPGAKEGMRAEPQVTLQTLTVEQADALRLSAILDIECMALETEPLRVLAGITGAEDLERAERAFETVRTVQLGQDAVRIREDVSAQNVFAVLRAGGSCLIREVRIGGDTAIAEGTLTVTALTAAADDRLSQLVQHVPVTLEIPLDAALPEGAAASAEAEVEAIELAPFGGESGLVSVEARIRVHVEAAEKQRMLLPLDAYAPSLPIVCTGEAVKLLARGETLRFKYGASETLSVPEGMPECYRVAYCAARPVVTSSTLADGRLTVEGLLFTRVLYQTEGGSLYAFTEDLPFRAESACPGGLGEAMADAKLVSAAASGGGRSIELAYALAVTARPYAIVETRLVTGMEERQPVPRQEGIIIYFAGEGETLFDVGKRFQVTRKRLQAANAGVTEALADGEKLILLM